MNKKVKKYIFKKKNIIKNITEDIFTVTPCV